MLRSLSMSDSRSYLAGILFLVLLLSLAAARGVWASPAPAVVSGARLEAMDSPPIARGPLTGAAPMSLDSTAIQRRG